MLASPPRTTSRFEPSEWATGLERVERFYQQRGYYQAQVVEVVVELVSEEAVRLVIRVDEGEPTRVTPVDIRGLEALPAEHREAAHDEVELAPGDIHLEERWESLEQRMVSALAALGYAEASASGKATVDLAQRTAQLEVALSPGVRYVPGDIIVEQTGDERVPVWRIREHIEEALDAYRWYSPEAVREAQQQVFAMGVFAAVEIEPGKGDPSTGRLPLRVSEGSSCSGASGTEPVRLLSLRAGTAGWRRWRGGRGTRAPRGAQD